MRNWIIVEKGEPYTKGTLIEVIGDDLWMGRISEQNKSLDINFASMFISRKHCHIFCDGMKVILADRGSKHGTFVNGNRLSPNEPHVLNDGDRISLAKGIVVLQFRQGKMCEKTLDFSDTQADRVKAAAKPIIINSDKRECIIDGQNVSLTCKEWNCLELLYKNPNKLITYNELAAAVWTERIKLSRETFDVGHDEINVLLYRLRKKMGKRGKLIKNIRGCGFVLEL